MQRNGDQGSSGTAASGSELYALFERRGTSRQLQAGEVLYEQDSSPDNVFLVTAGRLRLVRVGAPGTEEVGSKETGMLIGESAALDGGPRTVTPVAAEPTTVLVLNRDVFVERLRADWHCASTWHWTWRGRCG